MKTQRNRLYQNIFATFLTVSCGTSPVFADDIDIFHPRTMDKPNVLYILDNGLNMSTGTTPSGDVAFDVARDGLAEAVGSWQLEHTNVGIMHSNADHVTPVYPISDYDTEDVKEVIDRNPSNPSSSSTLLPEPEADDDGMFYAIDFMRDYVESIESSSAPSAHTDTFYEAYLNFTGKSPLFGAKAVSDPAAPHPSNMAGAMPGSGYISPIKQECHINKMVLITNARTQSESDEALDAIETLTGAPCENIGTEAEPGETCQANLVKHLASNDMMSSVANNQNILLDVIAINNDLLDDNTREYYKKLTAATGGSFSVVETPHDVYRAATASADAMQGNKNQTFTQPLYSPVENDLAQDNEFSHGRDVYLPVFSASRRSSWNGNVKKYQYINGQVVDELEASIYDQSGDLAEKTDDFWAAEAIGALNGGMAAQLSYDAGDRTIYTLDDAGEEILFNETTISKEAMGLDAMVEEKEYLNMIEFIRGRDPDWPTGYKSRYAMGDVLHSNPVIQAYETDKKKYVFVGDNEGLLHVVDAQSGVEQFAFIPPTFVETIAERYWNETGTHEYYRHYGIDGALTIVHEDTNGDNMVNNDLTLEERATLVFGLRRGGDQYYGLRINPNQMSAAELKVNWVIDSNTAGFERLGQTWSPTKEMQTYNADGEKVPSLFFAGGYDTQYDDPWVTPAAPKGNAVYAIDPFSGELLWSHSGAPLQHSITGGIRGIDVDIDGVVDRLYFGDLGGNVWRVDLNYDNGQMDGVLTHLASLSGSGKTARKFFYEPDVSTMTYKGQMHAFVGIGSGYTSNPLYHEVKDAYFLISDPSPMLGNSSQTKAIAETDLADKNTLSVDPNAQTFFDLGKQGWHYPLIQGEGEKISSTSTTFNSTILFNTIADAPSDDPCKLPQFKSRSYAINILKADAAIDMDGDNKPDDFKEMGVNNWQPQPTIVFNKPVASDGVSPCTEDDCTQSVNVMVGSQDLLKDSATANGFNNITDLTKQIYWVKRLFY